MLAASRVATISLRAGRALARVSGRSLCMMEKSEEVVSTGLLDAGQWFVAQAGDFLGDMHDPGGFVGPAAMRHRRQIGRVGLDQQAVERYAPGDFLQPGRPWRITRRIFNSAMNLCFG